MSINHNKTASDAYNVGAYQARRSGVHEAKLSVFWPNYPAAINVTGGRQIADGRP